jgi:hypothetical protein
MSNPSHPPALALWLLRRLCRRRNRDFLTGDLLERFGEGESRVWFWRQVMMAILIGVWRESIAHWPQIAFAAIGSILIWFWGGRSVQFILDNPMIARTLAWSVRRQPIFVIYDIVLRSFLAGLLLQPLLAVLLLLNGALRWRSLLRTTLISVPLFTLLSLAFWVGYSGGPASTVFFIALTMSALLGAAWIGCRITTPSTDQVLPITRAAVTNLALLYLTFQLCGRPDSSWWTLDDWNRAIAPSYSGAWRWIVPPELFLFSAICGWLATRLNGRYPRATLATLLGLWTFWFALPAYPYWSKVAVESIDHPWFRPYLASFIVRFLAVITGTLAGGVYGFQHCRQLGRSNKWCSPRSAGLSLP